ncbi:carbohydrate ABC transporter permease [Nonomuraea roseoviolacea]|uniref:Multiple sugar transport system permease protein n=1 Tax=Nonomuraea roseoviolacea subsp. carminata TaxID=160689 RepID=A0ABT1K234_9ACTN|nr:sugar ABC transporter permease [Nonomuraea roseoviolacea]MCP2348063.1 multiple sugar transport system permease protein [Nonomuraea roseoviolacea subsp. carminata]
MSTAGRAVAVKAAARPATRRRLRDRDWVWGYAMIAPLVLGLAVFYLWPVVQSVYYSFTEWTLFGDATWVGLRNYEQLFTDPANGRALRNTFVYGGLSLLGIPLSIAVAALLGTRGLRLVSLYRTLYFLPVVTMPAAVAMIWTWLYNGDYGLVNYLLSLVGIHGASWIAEPSTALYALVAVGIWTQIGYNAVIFMAGLQSIPSHLYEAASIDGAGRARQFFRITLPLLSPSIFFVSVLSVINGLQMFDLVYLMLRRGNPAREDTQTVVSLFFSRAFEEGAKGYAAAMAVVLMLITLVLTVIQFRVQKRWVHYA